MLALSRFFAHHQRLANSLRKNFLPGADNKYAIGSPSARWSALYVAGSGSFAGTMSGRSLNVMGTGSTALLFTHLGTNRVGIGTNAPKAKLDVVGTISGALITQNGSGSNYFRGNLGIGTTSPRTQLDIVNNSATAQIILDGSATQSASYTAVANTSTKFPEYQLQSTWGTRAGALALERNTTGLVTGAVQNDLLLYTPSGAGKKLPSSCDGEYSAADY